MKDRILLIGDPNSDHKELAQVLQSPKWNCKQIGADEYEAVIKIDVPDAVVIHTEKTPDAGRNIIERLREIDDQIPVLVVINESTDVNYAVELMKLGAFDVVVWPQNKEFISHTMERALHLYHLTKRVFLLESQVGEWQGKFDNLIGQSFKMQEIFQLISTVAKSNATVLITGESGTGKELVARAIHKFSARSSAPFMDLNCGAIPRDLLENELFGHEKGSFTGAEKRYIGCCEQASGGTLFLDEICEMDPSLQVKILRLLQERTFNRVGGTERINVDLRFIAATNRDVEEEVKNGNFREDLFYRLNVVPVHLPPLRDRPEDVPVLARSFMDRFAQKMEKPFVEIASDALDLLVSYGWPGNVRELENIMERVVVLNNDTQVKAKHLPPHIRKTPRRGSEVRPISSVNYSSQSIIPLDMVEKYAIESALEKCVGNVSEAAKKLKIGQATLYRKIRQYGLRN